RGPRRGGVPRRLLDRRRRRGRRGTGRRLHRPRHLRRGQARPRRPRVRPIVMPRWVWVPFGIGLAFLVVPLLGMLGRVPWAQVPSLLATTEARQALGLSLITCLIATGISVLLGVPLALALSRMEGRTAVVVRTMVTVPMV